jgi:hypothetical protein
MSFSFNPGSAASGAFRMTFAESMGERLMIQSELQSGWHSSRSDANEHLSIKNSNGDVTGHLYRNGGIKDFNGSLGWL